MPINSDGVDKDSDDSDWGFGSKFGTTFLSPPSAVEGSITPTKTSSIIKPLEPKLTVSDVEEGNMFSNIHQTLSMSSKLPAASVKANLSTAPVKLFDNQIDRFLSASVSRPSTSLSITSPTLPIKQPKAGMYRNCAE